MVRTATGGRRWTVLAIGLVFGAMAGPALAGHMKEWSHKHRNYPPKPRSLQQIRDVFGKPCSARADENALLWRAADDGVYYTVRYHRKLGGNASSNLNHDVKGHIAKLHLGKYVLRGIWGYNCRYMRGGSRWSTHAWGIAVDVSSAHEPNGRCWSSHNHHHAPIWKDHRWTWGKSWCDPMHFQYASGY